MVDKYLEDAARLRLVVARISRHLRAVDASSALTATQGSLLSTVVRYEQLRLSRLSELEGVDAPTLSRAVSRLEQQGLVRRLPDPDDGRAVIVEATGRGRRLQQRLREARADTLQVRLAELDPKERRLLHATLPVLEQVADALKAQRARP